MIVLLRSLFFGECRIESIEINIEHTPRCLNRLELPKNAINADGCNEIAKLLQRGDATTLTDLDLKRNKIDDEGVKILVNTLRRNTTLKTLDLRGNEAISNQGQIMLLKLVNDISSIEATLRSNHTLEFLRFSDEGEADEQILQCIGIATGREKIIETQLNSERRAELAELQGITHSVFSEIDPLHLPEVLALVGNHHGHGELYLALRLSIAGVISTVNRKQFLKRQIAEKRVKIVKLQAEIEAAETEIAAIEAAEGHELHNRSECHSNKKRRNH